MSARNTFPIPEIIYNPSLSFGPRGFLLGLVFADRAFAAYNLTSPEQLGIKPGCNELRLRLNWNLETSRSGALACFTAHGCFLRATTRPGLSILAIPSGDPADPENRAPDFGSKTGANPAPVQLPPIQQEYSSLQNRLHLLRTQRLIQTPVVQGVPDMSLANRRGKCTRCQELAILQFKRKVLHLGSLGSLGSLGNEKRDYGRLT